MAIESIVWASKAPDGKVIAPSTEKQQQGYDAEIPTAENFNWILRNVTGRLKTLEETWVDAALVSEAGTRDEVISAGEALQCQNISLELEHCGCTLTDFPASPGRMLNIRKLEKWENLQQASHGMTIFLYIFRLSFKPRFPI